jgi:hypothetical protein
MSTLPKVVVPLLRADALDKLSDDYELAAGVSLASGGQTGWPQTVSDLLTVAFCLRYVAGRLREGAPL